MSQQNVDTVRALYAALRNGDVPGVVSIMSPEIEWREAEGFIYAGGNPYIGPAAVLQGVFLRLKTEWEGFAAVPSEFLDAGDHVVVTGRYSGTFKETGKAIDAQYLHLLTVADGKVVKFQQYTDTLQVARAAGI